MHRVCLAAKAKARSSLKSPMVLSVVGPVETERTQKPRVEDNDLLEAKVQSLGLRLWTTNRALDLVIGIPTRAKNYLDLVEARRRPKNVDLVEARVQSLGLNIVLLDLVIGIPRKAKHLMISIPKRA